MLPLLRLAAMIFLALTAPTPVSSAEQWTLDQVRTAVEPSGRVKNIELERRTGWQTLHALAWTMELADPQQPDLFRAADAKQAFRNGQRFRLRIESATDLYIYVLVHNADGSQKVLLPEGPEQTPLLRAGQTVCLPATGAFRFEPPSGQERLRLLASPKLLPAVTNRAMWQLETSDHLTQQQTAELRRLQSARDKSIDAAVANRDKIAKPTGVRSVIGDIERGALTRGAEVVAAETSGEANLVTHASGPASKQALLVVDIVLNHVP